MAVPAAFSRLLFRGIQWDSSESGLSLFAGLKAAARGKLESVGNGRFVIRAEANGKSAMFQMPEVGRGSSQQDIAEELGRFLDLYDAGKASLIAGGIANPTDDQIATEVLWRIFPKRSVRNDFSQLRIGPTNAELEVAP